MSIFLFLSQDIGTVYQIFADEVLGSGQFGVVYGGVYASFRMSWEIEQGKMTLTSNLKQKPSCCYLDLLVCQKHNSYKSSLTSLSVLVCMRSLKQLLCCSLLMLVCRQTRQGLISESMQVLPL